MFGKDKNPHETNIVNAFVVFLNKFTHSFLQSSYTYPSNKMYNIYAIFPLKHTNTMHFFSISISVD